MKKKILTLALAAYLIPNTVFAAETDYNLNDDKVTNEYESFELVKESYDGDFLVRYYKGKDKETNFQQYIDVPDIIEKKVSKNDEESVQKVTKEMVLYYDASNNIQRLNELLIQYIPESPGSKISYSKEYASTLSENLYEVLDYIKEKNIDLDGESFAFDVFGDEKTIKEVVPYKTKDELYKRIEELADDLKVEWYENKYTYIISASILLIIGLVLILLKRR